MSYRPLEVILTPEESRKFFGPAPTEENPPAARASKAYKGLRVAVALVRDSGFRAKDAPTIGSPADVHELLKHYADDPQELFAVVVLNSASRVVGVCEVHRGTMSHVEVVPADILRVVLVAGASRFIVVHNHPSGREDPSRDDVMLTKRLKEAAKLLGLELLDHVVIGEDGFTAFSERGLL